MLLNPVRKVAAIRIGRAELPPRMDSAPAGRQQIRWGVLSRRREMI